jgi:autotransporter-associated beta strand protein
VALLQQRRRETLALPESIRPPEAEVLILPSGLRGVRTRYCRVRFKSFELGRAVRFCLSVGRAAQVPLFLFGLLLPGVANAQVQNGSFFSNAGPAPRFGTANAVQSADQAPNGTESGAIQAILPDPALGANTIFAGSPNGGIWVTTNGGTSWTPLTDKQSSLSIASLGLDPTDLTGKTIIAGIGLTSNGSWESNTQFQGRGGPQNGLLYSTNGGASWSLLGTAALQNQSVIGVAARGNTILAATFEEQAFTNTQAIGGASYGLYRSTNGGASFSLVSGGSGLPSGAVSSLVADPNNPNRFFAAVTSVATPNQTAVYVSNDQGSTWSAVFTQANSNGTIKNAQQTVLTLATGPNGALAVAVSNVNGGLFTSNFTGLFLSQNGGTSWNQLTTPNVIHEGTPGQTPVNLHIAIDPTNANIVYVSGDAFQSCGNTSPTSFCSINVQRVVYNPNTHSSAAASLTFEGTGPLFSDANTVHADSRAIAFDSQGRLILSSDGGIYLRNNPQGAGTWQGLNGNMSVFEPYAVAFDANSKRAAIAAQDNGVALQSAPGSSTFNAIHQGDGTNVVINDRTLAGVSAIYSTSQNLGIFSRMMVNTNGQVVSPFPDPTNPGGVYITCNGRNDCGNFTSAGFSSPLVLNRIDPTKMAIGGGNQTFITTDPLTNATTATSIDLTLTGVGGSSPAALAYGTLNNPNALLVGGADSTVWRSTAAGTPNLVQLTYNGQIPTSVVFDNRTQQRYFIVDSQDLWYGGGTTISRITGSLPTGFVRPLSTEFISNNGVNALLVGGQNVPLTCTSAPNGCVVSAQQSPITAADSDSTGNLSGWRAFGQGLPNALVSAISYNPTVDTLVVGVVGRGAWTLFDVTSNFASATVLQFGLANNDSNPDTSILTDGTVGNRPLIKYGTDILTIAGAATYTGGTTIKDGMMVLGTGGTSGSILGNVTFCSNAADPSCNATNTKSLAFNRSDVYSFAGSISGPGQLLQVGTGTTILTGASTYSGPTTVNAGTLTVNGSITSQVFVNPGATLAGSGTIGTVNNAGILAPGSPTGTLTIQGNLIFAAASAYLIQFGATDFGKTNVTGTASLAGTVVVAPLPGGNILKQATILTANGGVTNTFSGGVAPDFAALNPSLSYTPNSVVLNEQLNYNALGALNTNQQIVGNVLANFFNSNGVIPAAFAGLTPSGLSQVAGEAATGSQQTTFQAMTQFITALLDPFIDGRGGSGTQPTAASPYAEEGANAYASTGKARGKSERDAYAAVYRKAPFLNTVYDPRWSVWAAGFGGSQTTDGNLAVGSNTMTSSIYGTAVGADYLLSPRTILGFAVAGGGTSFNVNTFGTGRSDLFQAGAFVRHTAGQAYISGALAYGWQNVTTDRIVTTVGAMDHLQANFNANALSGRIEGGYRYVAPWVGGIGLTPYAAGQFTTFFLPSYAEQALVGTNMFALAYGSQTVTDTRTELGLRTDKSFAVQNGLLTLRGRAAWAHDFNPSRAAAATFQTLPGASFVVNGAAIASDTALTTASAEVKWLNGWSAAATFDSELSQVTRSYAGKGVVRYAW